MDARPIGILDSGVGGLSVFKELRRLLPGESTVYFADTALAPYGTKTSPVVVKRVLEIIRFLEKRDVKLIIIACNTATVCGMENYRQMFPQMPIVGLVPVVKTAARLTKTGVIGVLATRLTLESAYQKRLEQRYASKVKVVHHYPDGLVELVEKGNLTGDEVGKILIRVQKKCFDGKVGALALGCTHYVFVKDEIERLVGPDIFVVDSSSAVVRQVWRVLRSNDQLNDGSIPRGQVFFTSSYPRLFYKVGQKLLHQSNRENIDQVSLAVLESYPYGNHEFTQPTAWK